MKNNYNYFRNIRSVNSDSPLFLGCLFNYFFFGLVAERFKASVLKTDIYILYRVRIPPIPFNLNIKISMLFYLSFLISKFFMHCCSSSISAVYFTLAERKVLGAIQRRRGPNVGVFGYSTFIRWFKTFVKEAVVPSNSNKAIFQASPVVTFLVSLVVRYYTF